MFDDTDAMDFSEEYPGEAYLTGPPPRVMLCDIVVDANADEIEARIFGGWIDQSGDNARLLFTIATSCESERLIDCASRILVSWLESDKAALV